MSSQSAAVAEGCVAVARNLMRRPDDASLRGVFHMTCAGEASWADFAEAVFAGAAQYDLPVARVRRITTSEYPTPAPRPANSRLDCRLIASRHGIRAPDLRQDLDGCLASIAKPPGASGSH